MLLRTLAGSCAARLATKASAAAAQRSFGRVGRCSSSAWVSVPRRKRASSASADGGRIGGSARRLPGRSTGSPSASLSSGASLEGASGTVISGSGGAGALAQAGSGLAAVEAAPPCRGGLGLGRLRAGEAPDDAPVRGRHLLELVGETVADQIVPAVRRRRVAALEARHIEPVARARQRHVEQPVALLRLGLRRRRLGLLHDVEIARALDRPQEGRRRVGRPLRAVELQQAAGPPPRSGRAGVGQEHDRRLQALGAVHGHDAHLVVPLLHVALDHAGAVAQPAQEPLQRRRRRRRRRRAPG